MATINSLMSASSSNAYGSQTKGIGGLASGLNTDELIDGMTIATRSKIAKQNQNKTLLSWRTDAYRSISSKLIEFADKYTSYASSTNLHSESFYGKTEITAKGENSTYVSVTGTADSAQLSVLGVKQLAQDASFTTSEPLSNNYIQTGTIEYGTADTCALTGKTITVEYGTTKYVVTMPEKDGGGFYTNAADVMNGLNTALAQVDIGGGKNLSEVMSVTANGETLSFKNATGNNLKIVSGDATFMNALGITAGASSIVDQNITDAGLDAVAAINPDSLQSSSAFSERLMGKSIMFEYNGVKKAITFDDETKLEDEATFVGYIQDELNTAFGQGRIELNAKPNAEGTGNFLEFQTTLPVSGDVDQSSVLRITSSSPGVLGESGVFGIASGATNKLNLTTPLKDSGIKDAQSICDAVDTSNNLVDGEIYKVRINGESIEFTYKEDETSLGDIINAINSNERAGVEISYQPNSDSFSIISTQKGASGKVEIGGTGGELNDLERLLFGKRTPGGKIDSTINELNGGAAVPGKDAVILVDFDGAGGADPMEISRGTNSFTLDGMTIGVNGTFGYDGSGVPIDGTEAVTFDAGVDTDKIFDAVKEMVNDYNELIKLSNTAVKEKRNRDYPPLTNEQKEEMTETEIKNWEEKAKEGMLFGDRDIINLTNDLRFAFLNTRTDGLSFADIGITVSTSWKDNGKITLDESKLKAALQENPDNVKSLFTEASDGNSLTSGGAMTRMKAITDKYAATTGANKGILVEKAGSKESPSSMLKNTLLTELNDIDEMIKKLESKLATERTRYQKQFTALEQLTQQMNAQSGWLAQQFGGY